MLSYFYLMPACTSIYSMIVLPFLFVQCQYSIKRIVHIDKLFSPSGMTDRH